MFAGIHFKDHPIWVAAAAAASMMSVACAAALTLGFQPANGLMSLVLIDFVVLLTKPTPPPA